MGKIGPKYSHLLTVRADIITLRSVKVFHFHTTSGETSIFNSSEHSHNALSQVDKSESEIGNIAFAMK